MAPGNVISGRRVNSADELIQPGDYVLDSINDNGTSKPCVWFLLPTHRGSSRFRRTDEEGNRHRGSGMHMVMSPPWVFRECDDGSIEIRESIACGRGERDPSTGEDLGEYWHGYLDEGHQWREV